jgi:hypothetical protein
MKQFIYATIVLLSCNTHSNSSQDLNQTYKDGKHLDSLKWFFYAYTYEGKALFKKDGKVYEFYPTECEIKVNNENILGDSIIYNLSYYKKGYTYQYIYEGLIVNGFVYNNGIYNPLTGMVKLDNFENLDYVKADNIKTDSIFKSFLRSADSGKLFHWLFSEAKKRRVF